MRAFWNSLIHVQDETDSLALLKSRVESRLREADAIKANQQQRRTVLHTQLGDSYC